MKRAAAVLAAFAALAPAAACAQSVTATITNTAPAQLGAPAATIVGSAPSSTTPATTVVDPNAPQPVTDLSATPPNHRLTGFQARALADKVPKIVKERRKWKGNYSGVYLKGGDRWQVSYFSRDKPPKEIGQVLIDDRSARVTEAWTRFYVPWTMARGYPGAFGRKVNSPWVWIPLTALFLLAFFDWRRPLSLLHLDLLVLAAFGISVAYFNDANIDTSVPIVYPLLAYLLGRMLWIGLRRAPPEPTRPLALLVPVSWLAIGVIFLMGFRVGLNITSSNVIDVGYASVVGGDKLLDNEPWYKHFPKDVERGDTYGPTTYAAYAPFVAALGFDGRWDELPAAHGASIAFDVLCLALLFLLGRQIRGPGLGVALAFAWVSFPFTLYAANTGSNDALVAVGLLATLAVAGRPVARGAMAALGGLTKFATLGVAPLFMTHGDRSKRALFVFAGAFTVAALIALLPVFGHGQGLRTVYDRTVAYQADRGSPFSIWGLYDLSTLQHVWQALAVLLAVGLAIVPRRKDVVGLTACAAAIVIALELGVTHWFYLYVVWFFPLVMVALLARSGEPART